MSRIRLRIRFRKEGDLRLISHRDLVRVFERLFRRAELNLAMSQGFHPKPRMTLPSALGLGIEAKNELLEVELAQPEDPDQIAARLRQLAPHGLVVTSVHLLSEGEKKARLERLIYEFPVPDERREQVETALEQLLSQESYLIEREGRDKPIDVRECLIEIKLEEQRVTMVLPTGQKTSVRPREILAILGLDDLEGDGFYLTRTAVEIAS